jgi:glutathione S-transferase
MSLLDIEHEWIHLNVLGRETHSTSFMAMNPNAKMPVMEIMRVAIDRVANDPATYLWESNAILNYLAEGTAFLPAERLTGTCPSMAVFRTIQP